MYTLNSQHRIYASHQLKNQGGRCERLHGHQYEIILTLKSEKLDYKTMIVDTYEIEKIFDRFIGVDHLHLNEFMNEDNPTMEFMAKYFYDNLKEDIPLLSAVTVYETPEGSVTYEGS